MADPLSRLSQLAPQTSGRAQPEDAIFTILGGTTIPDHAAIVRAECREGSKVELRRQAHVGGNGSRIEVWLACRSLLGLVKAWKRIGYVPDETVETILPIHAEGSTVVAYGTVRSVYAPEGRDEAVVTVKISPQPPA